MRKINKVLDLSLNYSEKPGWIVNYGEHFSKL